MIRDHNPYSGAIHGRKTRAAHHQVPPGGTRWRRKGASQGADRQKVLFNEGRVIEDTMRLVKMAHRPVP
eukprot:4748343-Pleurochrysis_carterae.AAC.1